MDFENCKEVKNCAIVKIVENKRAFSIQNLSRTTINKIRVDGCLIDDNTTQRCDYLFEVGTVEIQVLYVELKGGDISHGIKQLSNTMKFCESRHRNFKKSCYIVSSRVPSAGTDIQRQKKEFYKSQKCNLIVKNILAEVYV